MKSGEERHLESKIRMAEDNLLRSKDCKVTESIQSELKFMRAQLQRLQFRRVES